MLAIADSAGFITEAYAGSGHDQSSWQGAGVTTQAQSYNPRKWQTDDQWGGIQQFRNRAYDPATGTWIQEDPMGVAGGVNVYRFNNGNPVSFGDPFGLCPAIITGRPCSGSLATAVGFIPGVGDAIDILGAAVGKDLLTGESIGGVGIAATVVGTVFGSGRLARQAADVAGGAVSGSRRAFNNTRIMAERKIKGNSIAIDLEMGGSQVAKVQLHLNGGRIFVNNMDEAVAALPSRLRKNDLLREQLQKAFDRAQTIRETP